MVNTTRMCQLHSLNISVYVFISNIPILVMFCFQKLYNEIHILPKFFLCIFILYLLDTLYPDIL